MWNICDVFCCCFVIFLYDVDIHVIQICSGITRGRVLNGELCAQRLQKLIYLINLSDKLTSVIFVFLYDVDRNLSV